MTHTTTVGGVEFLCDISQRKGRWRYRLYVKGRKVADGVGFAHPWLCAAKARETMEWLGPYLSTANPPASDTLPRS